MAEWAINPLFLFLTVWVGVTGLYLAGILTGLFSNSSPDVFGVVFLNIAGFSLGYLTWNMLCCRGAGTDITYASAGTPLTVRRLKVSLHITLICGLIAVGMCLKRMIMLSETYNTSLINLMYDPNLWRRILTTYIDQSVYETRLTTMLISLSSGMLSIGFILLGILLYFGRRWTRYLYAAAFLSVTLAIGFLNLGRKEVAVNIVFVVLSYLFVHQIYHVRKTSEILGDLVLPPIALGVLFVVIDIVLRKGYSFHRGTAIEGFFFSLYWYIASPLGAFAEFIKEQRHEYLMGQSLFFPVYKWLHRFGLVPAGTVSILSEKIFIPYIANVYSYLRNMYEDFGLFGVAVVPYVLGSLMAVLRRRAELFLPYMNLYLVLLVLIIFSFYNYLLISNQYYLQIVFVFLFFRFRLTDLDKLSA
jgi:oligosaccharide repeat unit polymerase